MRVAGALDARVLVPERLDGLAHDDPAALRSRGDLARINRVMGAARLTARLAAEHAGGVPARILEIGCGDAAHSERVARRLAPLWPGARLVLLDVRPAVPEGRSRAIERLGWSVEVVPADALAWLGARAGRYDLCLANLFVHHFEGAALGRLLEGIARAADVVVATEPSRDRASLAASRLVGAIGANRVTRHDAPASVRAGFRGGELAALWPPGPAQVLLDERRAPFTHAFVARGHRGGRPA